MANEGRQVLQKAYEEVESELPDRLARVVRWLRAPEKWWLRVSVGLLFIAGSAFFFLPVLGLEWLPIGLLILAQDVPFLRKPMGHAMLWLVHRYRALKGWWQEWRERRLPRQSVKP